MIYCKTFLRIFYKRKNLFYLIFLSLLIFLVLRIIPHWNILWSMFIFEAVSWSAFWNEFFYRTIFIMSDSNFWNNFIALVFPILISLNIILFKELYLKQRFILKSKSVWASLSGMFLGLFGVGCAACSGLLLAPIIGLLGLGGVLNLLPYGGEELAYLGLILIIFSNIYLLKKISQPNTC